MLYPQTKTSHRLPFFVEGGKKLASHGGDLLNYNYSNTLDPNLIKTLVRQKLIKVLMLVGKIYFHKVLARKFGDG